MRSNSYLIRSIDCMGQNRMNDVLVIQCMTSQFQQIARAVARDRPRGCMSARISSIVESGRVSVIHDSVRFSYCMIPEKGYNDE